MLQNIICRKHCFALSTLSLFKQCLIFLIAIDVKFCGVLLLLSLKLKI